MGSSSSCCWCLLLVLLLSGCCCFSSSSSSEEEEPASCPLPDDIFPCVCASGGRDGALDLDCSAVAGEEELAGVFQANFPSPAFRRLVISGNGRLRALRGGALGAAASFREFWLTDGVLEEVEEGALDGSASTAVHLVLHSNRLARFPFGDLRAFPRLDSLDLRGNLLRGFPEVASASLRVLYLSQNPLGSLPAEAFSGTPSLVDVHLSGCDIPELIPGTFGGLDHLRNVGLGKNRLTRLQENSIVCGPSMGLIDVGYNAISSVQPNVFPGLVNGWVYIHHNHLETLDEAVWRQMLVNGGYFDPYGNPLHCACDVAWILRNSAFLDEVDVYSTCADGQRLVDLNVTDYEHC